METRTYSQIEGEIQSLQNTISSCEERIRACRTRQNDLTNVAKLPHELLTEIFLYLVLEEVESMSLRWIRVTHVCSRWRRIALDCPKLWSWPSFRRGEHVDTMLRRSRTAPLNVTIYMNGRCSEKSLQSALFNLHRTQTLTAYEIDPTVFPHYLRTYHGSQSLVNVPILRSLTLSTTYIRARRLTLDDRKIHAPQLTYLKLHNWGLPQTVVASQRSIPLKTLDVSITKDGSQGVQQNTLREVLNHLYRFQGLRSLSLSNVFFPDEKPEDPETAPPPVELPFLNQLTIHATPQICRRFIESIVYPGDTATVSVQCLRSPTSGYSACEIRGLLHALLGQLKDSVRALHILPAKEGKDRHTINFWPSPCNEDLEYTERPAAISISVPFDRDILKDISHLVQMQDLEHLLYHAPTSHLDLWKDFGNLKHLCLIDIGNTHLDFLEAFIGSSGLTRTRSAGILSKDGAKGSSDSFARPFSLPFNALRDLTFNDWTFEGLEDSRTDFSAITRELSRRQDCGCRISNLHIWGCTGITCADVEGFMSVAENVYWDG